MTNISKNKEDFKSFSNSNYLTYTKLS